MTDYYAEIAASDEREEDIETDTNPSPTTMGDFDFSVADTGFKLRGTPTNPAKDGKGKPLSRTSDKSLAEWQQLQRLNNGYGESSRAMQNRIGEYRMDMRHICGVLGCAEDEREHADSIVTSVDLRFKPGDSIEDVLLGIGLYVSSFTVDDPLPTAYSKCVDGYGSDMDTIERIADTIDAQPERMHENGQSDCLSAQFDGDTQAVLTKYAIDRIDDPEMFEYIQNNIDNCDRDDVYEIVRKMNE